MLGGGEPDTTLVRAAAANQTAWLARIAEAAGGTVHRERGVTWMVSRAGAVLAFPRLSSRRLAVLLPDFLAAAGSAEASCWSLLPTEPEDLDLRLREAGFRDGWQAHWMARTIEDVEGDPAAPGVSIAVAEGDWSVTKLPWDEAGIASVRTRLASARPRRVWHVAVWREDEAVGHATLNVTTGRLGVAGIYDMGVASHERRRGIGTALTHAVLARARGAGCAVATLNATADGEHLYRKLGFRSVGFAQTWWR